MEGVVDQDLIRLYLSDEDIGKWRRALITRVTVTLWISTTSFKSFKKRVRYCYVQ